MLFEIAFPQTEYFRGYSKKNFLIARELLEKCFVYRRKTCTHGQPNCFFIHTGQFYFPTVPGKFLLFKGFQSIQINIKKMT